MLTNKAIQRLAGTLASEVAAGIFESEEWVNLCHEVIPALITEKLGELDDDLLIELSLCVMDRISIKVHD